MATILSIWANRPTVAKRKFAKSAGTLYRMRKLNLLRYGFKVLVHPFLIRFVMVGIQHNPVCTQFSASGLIQGAGRTVEPVQSPPFTTTASTTARYIWSFSAWLKVGDSPVVPVTTKPSEPFATKWAARAWALSIATLPAASNGVTIAVKTLPKSFIWLSPPLLIIH